jgi:IS605 OrfB family transposase
VLIPACFLATARNPHLISEIVQKGTDWYLMLTVRVEDVPSPEGERPKFGVDLGVANLAVLAGPGVVKFFGGKRARAVRDRCFGIRQALQKKRKTGMVKRSKGKESRWMTSENHRISRRIVDIVAGAGGVLYVERLQGIRDRIRCTAGAKRVMHSWAFGQLLEFLEYKANLAGVPVKKVDPRKTSQTCSRCGHAERGNRPRQADFRCKRCGYTIHADLNGARVIAAGGACFIGVGGVTPPDLDLSGRSGEAVSGRKVTHRGNRNLVSSA